MADHERLFLPLKTSTQKTTLFYEGKHAMVHYDKSMALDKKVSKKKNIIKIEGIYTKLSLCLRTVQCTKFACWLSKNIYRARLTFM